MAKSVFVYLKMPSFNPHFWKIFPLVNYNSRLTVIFSDQNIKYQKYSSGLLFLQLQSHMSASFLFHWRWLAISLNGFKVMSLFSMLCIFIISCLGVNVFFNPAESIIWFSHLRILIRHVLNLLTLPSVILLFEKTSSVLSSNLPIPFSMSNLLLNLSVNPKF